MSLNKWIANYSNKPLVLADVSNPISMYDISLLFHTINTSGELNLKTWDYDTDADMSDFSIHLGMNIIDDDPFTRTAHVTLVVNVEPDSDLSTTKLDGRVTYEELHSAILDLKYSDLNKIKSHYVKSRKYRMLPIRPMYVPKGNY